MGWVRGVGRVRAATFTARRNSKKGARWVDCRAAAACGEPAAGTCAPISLQLRLELRVGYGLVRLPVVKHGRIRERQDVLALGAVHHIWRSAP